MTTCLIYDVSLKRECLLKRIVSFHLAKTTPFVNTQSCDVLQKQRSNLVIFKVDLDVIFPKYILPQYLSLQVAETFKFFETADLNIWPRHVYLRKPTIITYYLSYTISLHYTYYASVNITQRLMPSDTKQISEHCAFEPAVNKVSAFNQTNTQLYNNEYRFSNFLYSSGFYILP